MCRLTAFVLALVVVLAGFGFVDVLTAAGKGPAISRAWAQSPPARDIVGLQQGMTYDEIAGRLQERGELGPLETAQQWIRQSHGIPTRQLVRAADGTPCEADARPRREAFNYSCNDFGGRFPARRDIRNEVIVAFIGMPEQEIAVSIWRQTTFADGELPTVADLEQALAE